MYWTDGGPNRIWRANLDGSGVEALVTSDLESPTAIALDLVNRKVYWAHSGLGTIKRANLDGSGIEEIVSGGTDPDD